VNYGDPRLATGGKAEFTPENKHSDGRRQCGKI
jgi:hypothetical protein